MTFFKIIQDSKVINVGCTFLKWNNARQKLYICDVDDAQFAQALDEDKIYRADWLNPAPEEAGKFETADVVVIDEVEFDELKELLSEGEDVPEEFIEEKPLIEVRHYETDEEKPMSIAEMREKILEQQKQIEALLEKLQ